jgi:hypothetical protein
MGWLASEEGFSIMKKIVKKKVDYQTKIKVKRFTKKKFQKLALCHLSCQKSLDKELT